MQSTLGETLLQMVPQFRQLQVPPILLESILVSASEVRELKVTK
jgi:hypothetical protein